MWQGLSIDTATEWKTASARGREIKEEKTGSVREMQKIKIASMRAARVKESGDKTGKCECWKVSYGWSGAVVWPGVRLNWKRSISWRSSAAFYRPAFNMKGPSVSSACAPGVWASYTTTALQLQPEKLKRASRHKNTHLDETNRRKKNFILQIHKIQVNWKCAAI